MQKTTGTKPALRWAGIDLHVHTPASRDYQGPNERSEYLRIIQRANEFEDPEARALRATAKRNSRPIRCIAFTDHNSVNGFIEWKNLYDETVSLAEAVRDRDPSNILLQQLDKDLSTLRSVRVLMGFELNAYPGVHLLVICHESVKPETAQSFLAQIYGKSYEEIAGDPAPLTETPIEDLLALVPQTFGDQAMVIAPHIESGGGLYEVLKDLHQVRMPVLRHESLFALSFNKAETRDKLRSLLCQPDYGRVRPLALIQSSDAHGSRGIVGQPRTEVRVPNGRPTFSSIREAFLSGRLKCSVDFVDEEYCRLVEGETLKKFVAAQDTTTFKEEDHEELAKFFCAASNSRTGVVQLDITIKPEQELKEFYPEQFRSRVTNLLDGLLEPMGAPLLTRALLMSATRVRVLLRPFPLPRLYTIRGIVYVIDGQDVRPARASEIETKVAELIERRFGPRFEKTLKKVSEESILLSKMPQGIPLYLRAREQLSFFPVKELVMKKIESTTSRGRDIADETRNLGEQIGKEHPFGLSKGNTCFLKSTSNRFEHHYVRFSPFMAELKAEQAERLASAHIDKPSIVVTTGGAAFICDAGFIIAESPAVLIELPTDFQGHVEACLGWLRSSFFTWYCAVHLSDRDLYQQLQKDIRLPFPSAIHREFFKRLDGLAKNIILEERRFLDDIQKQIRRGADANVREKLRHKHNNTLNGVCLTIDHEINRVLGLTEDEVEFVARTIRDMGLTDFGALDEIERHHQSGDEKELEED